MTWDAGSRWWWWWMNEWMNRCVHLADFHRPNDKSKCMSIGIVWMNHSVSHRQATQLLFQRSIAKCDRHHKHVHVVRMLSIAGLDYFKRLRVLTVCVRLFDIAWNCVDRALMAWLLLIVVVATLALARSFLLGCNFRFKPDRYWAAMLLQPIAESCCYCKSRPFHRSHSRQSGERFSQQQRKSWRRNRHAEQQVGFCILYSPSPRVVATAKVDHSMESILNKVAKDFSIAAKKLKKQQTCGTTSWILPPVHGRYLRHAHHSG